MTARPPATPDQPDTTPAADHIDTIARVRTIGQYHRPASVSVERASVTCQCGHESTNSDGLEEHRATLIVGLFLSDPAVVRALAAHLWAQHPDVVLTTGTEAGALGAEIRDRQISTLRHPRWVRVVRLVTEWREVEP